MSQNDSRLLRTSYLQQMRCHGFDVIKNKTLYCIKLSLKFKNCFKKINEYHFIKIQQILYKTIFLDSGIQAGDRPA